MKDSAVLNSTMCKAWQEFHDLGDEIKNEYLYRCLYYKTVHYAGSTAEPVTSILQHTVPVANIIQS